MELIVELILIWCAFALVSSMAEPLEAPVAKRLKTGEEKAEVETQGSAKEGDVYKNHVGDITELGDRMKLLENYFTSKVEPTEGFIIRCDGCSFSKFTKGFKPPYDKVFVDAMVLTMNGLLPPPETQISLRTKLFVTPMSPLLSL